MQLIKIPRTTEEKLLGELLTCWNVWLDVSTHIEWQTAASYSFHVQRGRITLILRNNVNLLETLDIYWAKGVFLSNMGESRWSSKLNVHEDTKCTTWIPDAAIHVHIVSGLMSSVNLSFLLAFLFHVQNKTLKKNSFRHFFWTWHRKWQSSEQSSCYLWAPPAPSHFQLWFQHRDHCVTHLHPCTTSTAWSCPVKPSNRKRPSWDIPTSCSISHHHHWWWEMLFYHSSCSHEKQIVF